MGTAESISDIQASACSIDEYFDLVKTIFVSVFSWDPWDAQRQVNRLKDDFYGLKSEKEMVLFFHSDPFDVAMQVSQYSNQPVKVDEVDAHRRHWQKLELTLVKV